MSFIEPLIHPVTSALDQVLPGNFGWSSPHLQPFNPNLPSAQKAFVNKYNTLQPVLNQIPQDVRNSLINFDMGRVSQGQSPLPIQQSIDAIKAATSQQAVTLAPKPNPGAVWSNSVRDIGQLASGLIRSPIALYHEAQKVLTEGPGDVARAIAAGNGNPIQDIHNLTQVPGIRMIPGAYIVGGLTGGKAGIENLASNPVFTALDALPFAQKLAEGTAVNAAQVEARDAALTEGKFSPELRPIRTVLTRTLDEAGNVVPNLPGRIGEHLSQTLPGRVLSETFSQAARKGARIEGAANIEYKNAISPTGLSTTDPLVQATRDAQTVQNAYSLDDARVAYLKHQSELGAVDSDPTITDTERAYLSDTATIQAKLDDVKLTEGLMSQFGDEFYDKPTASRLNSAQSRVDSLHARIAAEVIPRLQTTFNNYGDERIGNMITALQSGDTAAAQKIANGLYRGKTRLDKPQAVLTPRNIKPGDIAPADATLSAVGKLRRTITDTALAEKRLETAIRTNAPARFRPLIASRAADTYAETLAQRAAREGEQVAPVSASTAADFASKILQGNYAAVPGFDINELKNTADEIGRTWQSMRDSEGLNPAYYSRVTVPDARGMQYRGVQDQIPSADEKARVADISPSSQNIGVTLAHQGMKILYKDATENYVKEMFKAFSVNKADLAQRFGDEIQRAVDRDPTKDFQSHVNEVISQHGYSKFDASKIVDNPDKLGLDTEDFYVPKTIANNIRRSTAPGAYKLTSLLDPVTNTFRTSVLPLSPRWHVYNILGGGIMTAIQSGAGAFKYIGEARQLLNDLKSEDPAVVDAATDRLSRSLTLSLGSQVREADDLNFRASLHASNTLKRLFDEAGETSTVAKRFQDMASAASGGLHKVTDRSFELNQLFDDTYRVMSYLNEYDKNKNKLGLSDSLAQNTAIETARRIIHQWDEYTPIERGVLRQIMPFYGFCVDDQTEALTKRGWLTGMEIEADDQVLSMDPSTGQMHWSPINGFFLDWYKGEMPHLTGQTIDAFVTPGHKFATTAGQLKPLENLINTDHIRTMGTGVYGRGNATVFGDDFVRLLGWAVTEGHYRKSTTVEISQSEHANPTKVIEIRDILTRLNAQWHEYMAGVDHKIRYFGVTGEIAALIRKIAPARVMSTDFMVSLSHDQREMLIGTMLRADGNKTRAGWRYNQKSSEAMDAFVFLCGLHGQATSVNFESNSTGGIWRCILLTRNTARVRYTKTQQEPYDGYVWCPTTDYGTFVCRRAGKVYVTGNTQHIMRFAFKYPFDHPIRADLVSGFARNELQDQGTGLPDVFQNAFFFGHKDANGHQHALNLSGLNPFRDVANMLTLSGLVGSTNPVISTVLQQLGIENGQAELYPNLHYDPTSGQLVAVHDNPFVNFLNNTIPQAQILTSLVGASNAFKGLMAADPAAAKRALLAGAGLPILVRNYDLPKEYFKAEVKRQAAQTQARSDAFKSGDYSYASQFPGLAGLAGQVAQLQQSGSLAPLEQGSESTNPAYAAQVRQLTGR